MSILTLLIIIFLLVNLILILFLREVLSFIDARCFFLRKFINRNSGVFTIFFLFLFLIEQIFLVFFVYLMDVDARSQVLISLFALIVLTTAALEKFILEKKYQYQMREVIRVSYDNEQYLARTKELLRQKSELHEEMQILKEKSKH